VKAFERNFHIKDDGVFGELRVERAD
jgi:hypothetical protein